MTRRWLAFAAGGVLAALLLVMLAYTQLRERRIIEVVLMPEPVSLAPGGTQLFRVYGLVGASDTVAVKARYRATGGKITPGGLYTAGPVAGTYEVIATLYDDDYERFEFDADDDVERADDDDEDEFRLADTVTVTVMQVGNSGVARPNQAVALGLQAPGIPTGQPQYVRGPSY